MPQLATHGTAEAAEAAVRAQSLGCWFSASARMTALGALGELGEAASPQAGWVAARLEDPSVEVRRSVLAVLLRLGPKAAEEAHLHRVAQRLRDTDAEVRQAAAEVLRQCDDLAAPHVEALAAALSDSEESVRLSVAQALGRIGAAADRRTATALAACLRDESAAVRAAAMQALCGIGMEAVRPVGAQLESEDMETRRAAVGTLLQLGPVSASQAERIVRRLRDDDMSIRRLALGALEATGKAALHVEAIVRLSRDPGVEVRQEAVALIGRLGEAASSYAGDIAKALEDTEACVRRVAVTALGQLGAAGVSHIEALATRLADPHAEVWWDVVQVLEGMSDRFGPQAAAILEPQLWDPDPEVRKNKIKAFGHMRRRGAWIDESMARCAEDVDPKIRRAIPGTSPSIGATSTEAPRSGADVAGQIGDIAKPNMQAVARGLEESNPQAQWRAAHKLAQQGDIGATCLAGRLHHSSEVVRARAADALGRMHDAGVKHGSALAKLVRHDPVASVRRSAAEALGRLGSAPSARSDLGFAAAVEWAGVVAGLLVEPAMEALTRRVAIEALGGLGAAAAGQAAELAACLKDRDAVLRQRAAEALGRIGPDAAPSGADALVACLRLDTSPKARAAAARALGMMRAGEHAAVLAGRLKDPDLAVRASAEEALWRLGESGRVAVLARSKDLDPVIRSRAGNALRLMGEVGLPHAKVVEKHRRLTPLDRQASRKR